MRRLVAAVALTAGACQQDIVLSAVVAEVEVGPEVLDFGQVWVGEPVTADLTVGLVQGASASLLRVDVQARDGDVIAVEAPGVLTLERGSPLVLPVTFQADAPGLYASRIVVVVDDDEVEHAIEARGEALVPELVATPPLVDLGRVPTGQSGTARLRWANRGLRDVTFDGWRVDVDAFRVVEEGPFVVPVGGEIEVTVAYDAGDEAPANATLEPTAGGGALGVSVRLRANDCAEGDAVLYDRDGDGVTVCGGDCDDDDPLRRPGLEEAGNGVDDDCDTAIDEGTIRADDDGDGYCEVVGGTCTDGTVPGDCDDGDATRSAGAVEVLGNGIDDDCDGVVDLGSVDGDGDGWSADAGDCDDANANRRPGLAELGNGVDDDCDGFIDEGTSRADDDGDGYCEANACTDGSLSGDCDDSAPTIHPGAMEAGNRRDDDCDGTVDEGTTFADDDGDGFTEVGGDCDDANPDVNPARGGCD